MFNLWVKIICRLNLKYMVFSNKYHKRPVEIKAMTVAYFTLWISDLWSLVFAGLLWFVAIQLYLQSRHDWRHIYKIFYLKELFVSDLFCPLLKFNYLLENLNLYIYSFILLKKDWINKNADISITKTTAVHKMSFHLLLTVKSNVRCFRALRS